MVSPYVVMHGVFVRDVSSACKGMLYKNSDVGLFEGHYMDEKKVVRMVLFKPKVKSDYVTN